MDRKNSSNKYDIYYQKFDYKGDKLGETLIVRNPGGDTHLTLILLPMNLLLNNSCAGNISINTVDWKTSQFQLDDISKIKT